MSAESRVIRVFISSTFRDFQEERRLLVNEVFPELRRRARERLVEVVEVDLRWGITREEAERGETLPICLREIERSRPYFVGMLGERYGWVPERGSFSEAVLQLHPWLTSHAGSASVTEIEMLHGVLNSPEMAGRALFYLRDPAWAHGQGDDFVASDSGQVERLLALKRRIVELCPGSTRTCVSPVDLAERVLQDLWRRIDEEFPASETPSAHELDRIRHEAALFRHLAVLVGASETLSQIEGSVQVGREESEGARRFPLTVITGEPGSGKSAMLAVWSVAHSRRSPQDPLLVHMVGATAASHDPDLLQDRIIDWIQRISGRTQAPQEGSGSFGSGGGKISEWLGVLSEHAQAAESTAVILVDGIERLRADHALSWLPRHLPKGVHVIVSAGDERSLEDCRTRDRREIAIPDLDPATRRDFIRAHLARFDRRLEQRLVDRISDHGLGRLPGFLEMVLHELRCEADHSLLEPALNRLLACESMADLQACRLERVERQCGERETSAALAALWLSERGIPEPALLDFAGLTPRAWAGLRLRLDEAVGERDDGLRIADEALREAVRRRYLSAPGSDQAQHRRMLRFWAAQPCDARAASARIHHAILGEDWDGLQSVLLEPSWALAALKGLDHDSLVRTLRLLRTHRGFRLDPWLREMLLHWTKQLGEGAIRRLLQQIVQALLDAGETGATLDVALERLEELSREPMLKADARLARASVAWRRGAFEDAERSASEAAALRESIGLSGSEVAQARRVEAVAALAQRAPERAEKALIDAIARIGVPTPAERAELADMQVALADARTDLGKFREAHQGYMAARDLLDSHGYRSRLDVRDSLLHGLAILFKRTGQGSEGLDLALFAAQSRADRLGEDHDSVAMALHTAAGCCIGARKYGLGVELAQRAVAIADRTHGPDHPFSREFQIGLRQARFAMLLPLVAWLSLLVPVTVAVVVALVLARRWGWSVGLAALVVGSSLAYASRLQLFRLAFRTGLRIVSRRSPDWVPVDPTLRLGGLEGTSSDSA